MAKTDGGPAFPGTTSQPNERGVFYPVHHQGMSLRHWFAGRAPAIPENVAWEDLAGPRPADLYPYSGPQLTAKEHFLREAANRREWIEWQARAYAAWAAIYADAMIAACAQTEEQANG